MANFVIKQNYLGCESFSILYLVIGLESNPVVTSHILYNSLACVNVPVIQLLVTNYLEILSSS